MDSLILAAMNLELKKSIVGARINKISQPSEFEAVVGLRSGRENLNLYLSAHPQWARVNLTSAKFKNPQDAPPFCMVLRKHIIGGRITQVEQPGLERILRISIESVNEVGDVKLIVLIAEIMGKHSNIILVDGQSGIIYDGIKRVVSREEGGWKPRYDSSYRQILPQETYKPPPPQDKADPLQTDETGFLDAMEVLSGANPTLGTAKLLVKCFAGLSPTVAREISHLAGIDPQAPPSLPKDRERLWGGLKSITDRIPKASFSPTVYLDREGWPVAMSALELSIYNDPEYKPTSFTSASQAVDYYYRAMIERARFREVRGNLNRALTEAIKKCKKRSTLLSRDVESNSDSDLYRRRGELVTANLHSIRKGELEVVVEDYTSPGSPHLTIALDPTLTPALNAQNYFKRYSKMKRKLEASKRRLKGTEDEIGYLQNAINALDQAQSLEDLYQIETELSEEGYLHRQARASSKKTSSSGPRKYLTPDGWEIWVGRTGSENDMLSFRLSSSNDLWFHTRGFPGAHVILRNPNRLHQPPESILRATAAAAAYYSGARNDRNVPVDYTFSKHLRKAKGARPGMVTYSHQKTLTVVPSLEGLKAKKAN